MKRFPDLVVNPYQSTEDTQMLRKLPFLPWGLPWHEAHGARDSSNRALFSSPRMRITIPRAMNVNAKLLSTASMIRSRIGKTTRKEPATNAILTMNCRASPTK